MESKESNRRSFIRKIVGAAAFGGLAGLLFGQKSGKEERHNRQSVILENRPAVSTCQCIGSIGLPSGAIKDLPGDK